MKSISFFISGISPSGGTQKMLSLLCNLLAGRYQITVFVNRAGDSFYQLDSRVKLVLLPKNLFRKNLFLYKYLKRNRITHFIILDSNSLLFSGLLLPRTTRLIVWEHFSLDSNFKGFHLRLSRLYASWRAYKFILLSQSEAAAWQNKYKISSARINIIENPLTVDREVDTANKYHHKQVLAIGNNIEVKGFDLLIQAWLELETDWRLVIVGLAKDRIEELTATFNLKSNSNISLLEPTKGIADFYLTSSIFVLSSRKEASPLVLIESQSFGIPAIIFNHLAGAIELTNESALIADFSDPVKELKTKLKLLMQDRFLYQQLSERAIENSQRFEVELFREKWCDLLKIS